MANNKIEYSIGFKVDKTALDKIQTELKKIQSLTESDFKIFNPNATEQELKQIKEEVLSTTSQIEQALVKSFNPKLNSVSIQKFNQELKGLPLSQVASSLQKVGDMGKAAFTGLTNTLLSTKQHVKETASWMDKLVESFANTLRWKFTSGAIDSFAGTIQKAWSYAQKLDNSLNNIRIVTNKSAEDMEKFSKEANQAAKSLGASTTSYTNASLIYFQQGLGDKDTKARTETTIKAANVTGQNAAEVSEQLTAVWNGYKVVAEEAELYVDKLAAVAATTAADLEEISTGMSKVASAANAMGVNVDQLSAQLSTIISVTRQDASVVGTALKTIYSRMGDLKVEGVDEFGVTLGDVSSQMEQMGISVLDETGNLRDMGTVIEEVAAKWGTWTDAQQQAAAVAIAGKRQYNNLIALFENWNMYESALTTSQTSEGTLQKQQEIHMEKLSTRLQELSTAAEKFHDALIDNSAMQEFIKGLTWIVEKVGNFTDAVGGLLPMLGGLLPFFSTKIGGKLGEVVSSGVSNIKANRQNEAEMAHAHVLRTGLIGVEQGENGETVEAIDSQTKRLMNLQETLYKNRKLMSAEEYNENQDRLNQLAEEIRLLQEKNALIQQNVGSEERDPTQKNIISNESARAYLQGQKEKGSQAISIEDAKLRALEEKRFALQSWQSTPNSEKRKKAEELGLADPNKPSSRKEMNATVAEALDHVEKEILEQQEKLATLKVAVQEQNGKLDQQLKALGAGDTVEISQDPRQRAKDAREDAQNLITTSSNMKMFSQRLGENATGSVQKEEWNELTKSLLAIDKISSETKLAIAAITEELDNMGSSAEEVSEEQLEALREKIGEVADECSGAGEELNGFAEGVEQLADETDSLNSDIENSGNVLEEEMNKKVERITTTLTQAVGVVASLASAFSMLGNVVDIWKDEEATVGEKLKKTLSIGLSLMMMSLPLMELIAKKRVKDTADHIAQEGAKQAANTVTAATAWASLGPYILIAAAIAAVIALIAIFVANSKKEASAHEKAQKAAEDAARAAEEGAARVKELTAAYDELKDSIESYEEAAKALEEMHRETDEWKEAVKDLNSQVMDLISLYPELAAGFESSGGIYSINEEVLKDFQDKKMKETFAAMAISAALNQQAAAAKKVEAQEKAKKDIQDNEANLGVQTVVMGSGDTEREITIDFSRVTEEGYMTDERMAALITMTESSDEKIAEAAATVKQAVDENSAVVERQNSLINANTVALKNSIANKYGYDPEVFNWFTKGISDDVNDPTYSFTKEEIQSGVDHANRHNSSKKRFQGIISDNEGLAAIQELVISHTGKKVQDKHRTDVAEIIINSLKNMYPEGTVINVSSADVEKNVSNLGSVPVTIDGSKMTLEQAIAGASVANIEAAMQTDDVTKDMEAVRKADSTYDMAAAYFISGTDPSGWSNASISEFEKISGYNKLGDEYESNVKVAQENFISSILGAYDGYVRDDLLNSYSLFTDADFAALEKVKETAEKNNHSSELQTILDSYKDDPEALLRVSKLAGQVNWEDKKSVSDFVWNYTADIQEKVRKKELDYFVNINKELDRLNSELEKAIGLDRARLLEERKMQEENALAQAKKEEQEAWEVFNDYAQFYDYEDFIGADGSLDVAAVNDKIATLDKNKEEDKAEIERLQTFSNYWQDVINKENSVQNYIDTIIDSQIESFQYLKDFQKQLTEIFRQWEDLSISLKTSLQDYEKNETILKVDSAFLEINRSETDFLSSIAELQAIDQSGMFSYLSEGQLHTNNAEKMSLYQETLNEAMTSLEEYQKNADELYTSYISLQKEILQTYDKEIQKFESVNSILQSSISLMKIAKVDMNNINASYVAITENSKKQFELAQEEVAVFQDQLSQLSADAPSEWREEIISNLTKAGDKVLQKGQDYYTAIADQFSNQLSGLLDNLVGIDGASTLAGVTEDWTLYLSQEERYLDEINEAYAQDNLDRKFKKSIDEAQGIYAQNKLLTKQAELQQKLADIKEKQGKLSQADLNRANAEYELTLKQIALEEAQQASNKMKLTRDAMGNYSYQFVADEDAIAKTEEELVAAENNLYNMDKNRTQTLVTEYYSMMSEANAQIADAMASNDQERVERLREYYFGSGGILDSIQKELGVSSSNLSAFSDMYSTFTDSILQQDLTQASNDINTAITSASSAMSSLSSTVETLLGEGGSITQLTAQIADSINESIDTSDLTQKAQDIATQLPDLLGSINQFKDLLGGENGYLTKFAEWTAAVSGEDSPAGQILTLLSRSVVGGDSGNPEGFKVNVQNPTTEIVVVKEGEEGNLYGEI